MLTKLRKTVRVQGVRPFSFLNEDQSDHALGIAGTLNDELVNQIVHKVASVQQLHELYRVQSPRMKPIQHSYVLYKVNKLYEDTLRKDTAPKTLQLAQQIFREASFNVL